MELPEPECRMGYTEEQIDEIVGDYKREKFNDFMRGQTYAVCEGSKYDHEKEERVDIDCGPHGAVFYPHDVKRFLRSIGWEFGDD